MKKIFEQPEVQVQNFTMEDSVLNISTFSFWGVFDDGDAEAIVD